MTTTVEALTDIVEALPFIPLMTDSSAPGVPRGSSLGPRSKPPMNLEPQALIEDIHSTALEYVRITLGGLAEIFDPNPEESVQMLAGYVPFVEGYREFTNLEEDVSRLHNRVKALLGETKLKFLCPKCGEPAYTDESHWEIECSGATTG